VQKKPVLGGLYHEYRLEKELRNSADISGPQVIQSLSTLGACLV
jgi:hypothetical protein